MHSYFIYLTCCIEHEGEGTNNPQGVVDDGQNDCEDVGGPRVEAHVRLAQTQRKFLLKFDHVSFI